MSTNNIDSIKPRTTAQTFSYSTGFGLNNLSTGAVTTLLLLYYTGVTGISPWWYAFAQTVYAIYNAINDPLVGFLTDKNRPKMLKLGGKRFPAVKLGEMPALAVDSLQEMLDRPALAKKRSWQAMVAHGFAGSRG